MSAFFRETPAWPSPVAPAPRQGSRFAAARAEVRQLRQFVAVSAGFVTLAMTLSVVGAPFVLGAAVFVAAGRATPRRVAAQAMGAGAVGAAAGGLLAVHSAQIQAPEMRPLLTWIAIAAGVGFILMATPAAAVGLLRWAWRGTGWRATTRRLVAGWAGVPAAHLGVNVNESIRRSPPAAGADGRTREGAT